MEAKIHLFTQTGISLRTEIISEDEKKRESRFGIFEPPIIFEHGKGRNDPVTMVQGAKYEVIDLGENKTFTIHGTDKIFKIIHEANPEPF